ncbi:hypothetical protein GCK72_026145 [Caenorhabditis remanei]|uniref:Uncharacterized protein n=1 Tax=Caenorhabditis remanei TaxID=31234 RepID=A0A6A5G414_CAERE|nr:hypothetical protein GCK72_026145 [Caenorhabditis remanei]KAF1749677.1 hypothetical protein GCK72_026145 [Caenorhabditis remanei]
MYFLLMVCVITNSISFVLSVLAIRKDVIIECETVTWLSRDNHPIKAVHFQLVVFSGYMKVLSSWNRNLALFLGNTKNRARLCFFALLVIISAIFTIWSTTELHDFAIYYCHTLNCLDLVDRGRQVVLNHFFITNNIIIITNSVVVFCRRKIILLMNTVFFQNLNANNSQESTHLFIPETDHTQDEPNISIVVFECIVAVTSILIAFLNVDHIWLKENLSDNWNDILQLLVLITCDILTVVYPLRVLLDDKMRIIVVENLDNARLKNAIIWLFPSKDSEQDKKLLAQILIERYLPLNNPIFVFDD